MKRDKEEEDKVVALDKKDLHDLTKKKLREKRNSSYRKTSRGRKD